MNQRLWQWWLACLGDNMARLSTRTQWVQRAVREGLTVAVDASCQVCSVAY